MREKGKKKEQGKKNEKKKRPRGRGEREGRPRRSKNKHNTEPELDYSQTKEKHSREVEGNLAPSYCTVQRGTVQAEAWGETRRGGRDFFEVERGRRGDGASGGGGLVVVADGVSEWDRGRY